MTAEERGKLRERVDAEAARKYHVGLSLPHATVCALLDMAECLDELVALSDEVATSTGSSIETANKHMERRTAVWQRVRSLVRGEK